MLRRTLALFVQGLVAILPLGVTLLLLFWLGRIAEQSLGAGLRLALPQGWYITGMGVVAGIVLVFLAGLLVNVWGVPRLIRLGERLIARIPLVKTVYGAVHDLLGFFASPGAAGKPTKVVIVTLGQTGIRAVGLITREQFDDLPAGLGGEGFVAVYLPYSYQIGGVTLIVPREHVQPLDMTLEDAMRFIVTAGARAAPQVALAKVKD